MTLALRLGVLPSQLEAEGPEVLTTFVEILTPSEPTEAQKWAPYASDSAGVG